MEVCPRELAELIEVTPEISDNCRSSGAATDVAMVSAFAPGNRADIWTVGISTCGTPAIGSREWAPRPSRVRPMTRSVVAVGRTIKGAETFMVNVQDPCRQAMPFVRRLRLCFRPEFDIDRRSRFARPVATHRQ